MVTIGNDTTPGTVITMESNVSTGVNVGAPGDLVLVGQADLSSGTASANTPEQVSTPVQARKLFGDGSMLTNNIVDALSEGAYPVYAIAPEQKSVTDEDLSSLSDDSGTLNEAPLIEDAEEIVFTINSTTKTTVLVYDEDPTNKTPDTDEALVNPVTGKYQLDETAGNTGDSVDYEWFDYPPAFEAITDASMGSEKLRDIVDFIFSLNENSDVVNDLQTTVNELEGQRAFTIGIAGAGSPYITDTSSYSNSFTTSRMQLYYPSRNDDNESIMGSIAGLRARLGMNASPMYKTLVTQEDLQFTISTTDEANLIGEKVNPIRDQSRGALIVDDLTTVDPTTNSDERNYTQGLSRIIGDYVTEYADTNSQTFIGELHTPEARNALEGVIQKELVALLASDALLAWSLNVDKVDSQTASLDIGFKTVEPLRNIEITTTAGAVQPSGGE